MADYKHTLILRMCDDIKMTVAEAVKIAIDVQVDDLDKLTNTEINLVMKYLQESQDSRKVTMTKKIIHKLCLYGMTNSVGGPDMRRIQAFVINIGSRNPKKKKLNSLNYTETLAVLNQVSVMVDKEINKH